MPLENTPIMPERTNYVSLHERYVNLLKRIDIKDAMFNDFIHSLHTEIFVPPKSIHPGAPGNTGLFGRSGQKLLNSRERAPGAGFTLPGPKGINLVLRLLSPLTSLEIAGVNEFGIEHLRVMPNDYIKRLKVIPDIGSESGVVEVIRAFVLSFMGRKDLVTWNSYSFYYGTENASNISLKVSRFNIIDPYLLISLAQQNLVPNLLGELREMSEHNLSAITRSWEW